MFRPENKDGKVTISQLKKLEKSRVENIKNKFFRRTKRAPVAQSLPELSHIYMLNLDKGIDIQQAVKDFMADPNVEWAQANYPVSTHFIPDDPSYSSQWNLQKLQMEKAWDISQGEGIVVAVVDTGVDYTHPDLVNNIWLNPGEFPGVDDHGDGVITLPELIAHGLTDTNRDGKIDLADLFGSKFEDGIDHDGDGYINDFMGYDFTHCTQFSAGAPGDNGTLNGCVIPKEPGNNPMDRFPHGTHVAGIIAAQGNNATGIIGVAPKARIMPVKTISDFAERSFNGTFADAAEGLVYAARHGADVINNSWGPGYANGSEPLTEEAVRYAYGLGAVVVFSSGNDSDDVSAYSPDNMPEVIKVAATDEQDRSATLYPLGAFSEYGQIDVSAPGIRILSTVPGGYVTFSGTSMAAPHVAGLAALILSHNPGFSNEDVRAVIRASADSVGPPGPSSRFGFGRINAFKALNITSVLHAKITSPSNEFKIDPQNKVLKVTGSAYGPDFKSYQLFYSRTKDLGNWIPVAKPVSTPVVDGQLGVWDVSSLTPDNYYLRLVVSSTGGINFEDFILAFVDLPYIQLAQYTGNDVVSDLKINGNIVAWIVNSDLYFYNIATGKTTLIPKISQAKKNLNIANQKIVWADVDSSGLGDIYLYDIKTGDIQDLTAGNGIDNEEPSINANEILFEQYSPELNQIIGYNLNTNIQSVLTTQRQHLCLSNDWVLWGFGPVFDYNLKTNLEAMLPVGGPLLRVGTCRASDPDFVMQYYDWVNSVFGISHFNVSTNQYENIDPTPLFNQISPDVSGNDMVWIDSRDGEDVYLYNLASKQQEHLIPRFSKKTFVAISENYIAWVEKRVGAPYIFLYNLNNDQPVISPIGEQTVYAGHNLQFNVIAQAAVQSQLTLTASLTNGHPVSTIGASFTDNSNGQGSFSWTPTDQQLGNYNLIFTASAKGGAGASVLSKVTVSRVTYTITAGVNKKYLLGGTISPSGSVRVLELANQSFIISPNPGYYIVTIWIDGSPVASNPPFTINSYKYSFKSVSAVHTIQAEFYPYIAVSVGTGGTISPAGSAVTAPGVVIFNPGDNVTFKIMPQTRFKINQVLVDGRAVKLSLDNTYTFYKVTTPHTIKANFIVNK